MDMTGIFASIAKHKLAVITMRIADHARWVFQFKFCPVVIHDQRWIDIGDLLLVCHSVRIEDRSCELC